METLPILSNVPDVISTVASPVGARRRLTLQTRRIRWILFYSFLLSRLTGHTTGTWAKPGTTIVIMGFQNWIIHHISLFSRAFVTWKIITWKWLLRKRNVHVHINSRAQSIVSRWQNNYSCNLANVRSYLFRSRPIPSFVADLWYLHCNNFLIVSNYFHSTLGQGCTIQRTEAKKKVELNNWIISSSKDKTTLNSGGGGKQFWTSAPEIAKQHDVWLARLL